MPEKKASEIPPALRAQFEKGVQAIQRENLDYAFDLLSAVVQKAPEFLAGREALRRAAVIRAKKGTSIFKKVMNTAGGGALLAKAQILLKSNPLDAVWEAEKILTSDPVNVSAHKVLGEAAIAADLPLTALVSLEIVHQATPHDLAGNLLLANLHISRGQIDKAQAVYDVLLKHYPNDPELAMQAKNVSARKTMAEGGYDQAGTEGGYRNMLKNKAESELLEQEGRQVKDENTAGRLLVEYEKRLEAEPENLKLIRNIAELYTTKRDYYRALEYYNRLAEIPGGLDARIEADIREVTLKRYDQCIHEELDATAEDHETQKAALVAQRAEFLIDDCRRRVERYPTDMQARFEYGQLLFDAGKVGEAIAEFQKAQTNPNVRLRALLYLGKCFARRRMNDLAAKKLQEAINEKQGMDEEKKDLIYTLAGVLEAMDKKDDAIDQYKLIYEVDIGYRDVGKKVDDYYSAQ